MKNSKQVYLHINKRTNKVIYVGAGTEKRPYDFYGRSKEHKAIIENDGVVVRVLRKNLSIEAAAKLEVQLIKQFGLDNLLNNKVSGSGTKPKSQDTKDKLSKAQKGIAKHSEEFKQAQRERNLGKTYSAETKRRMAESRPTQKVIDTATGKEYNSIKEAAADLGVKYTTAVNQLRGRSKKGTLQYLVKRSMRKVNTNK